MVSKISLMLAEGSIAVYHVNVIILHNIYTKDINYRLIHYKKLTHKKIRRG